MKSTKQVRELLKHMHEQALHRQEQNRTHMASMRSETFRTDSTQAVTQLNTYGKRESF